MRSSMHLAVAIALLTLSAQAGAQTPRPPKPPTVVKTPPSTGTKIMTPGAAQGAQKAQGAGSLAPPPPGNAAIKGDAAIKGEAGAKSPRDPASGGSANKAAKMTSKGFAKQP